jgi:hypothetical protein
MTSKRAPRASFGDDVGAAAVVDDAVEVLGRGRGKRLIDGEGRVEGALTEVRVLGMAVSMVDGMALVGVRTVGASWRGDEWLAERSKATIGVPPLGEWRLSAAAFTLDWEKARAERRSASRCLCCSSGSVKVSKTALQ